MLLEDVCVPAGELEVSPARCTLTSRYDKTEIFLSWAVPPAPAHAQHITAHARSGDSYLSHAGRNYGGSQLALTEPVTLIREEMNGQWQIVS